MEQAQLTARRFERADIALALGVLVIFTLFVVPLSPQLIDILNIINLAFSLTILLAVLNLRRPMELSSFPSVLLLAIMFRFGLNVSATRLILSEGHAGEVINAFGAVVIGGNLVVGLVIFVILILLQFLVVVNGAGRASEVAARFTLDAMPGKQLGIDTDLAHNIIDAEEAARRRAEIAREADFYGALDGASKFVKGEVILAVVIVLVNIIGGLTLGILSMGMDVGTALNTFALLTVGDGLVNAVGSIMISLAMGLLVTRTAAESGLGGTMRSQVVRQPRALIVVGVLLGLLGFVPGFPTLLFIIAALFLVALGAVLARRSESPLEDEMAPIELEARPAASEEQMVKAALTVVPIKLEIGDSLLMLVDGDARATIGELTARTALLRVALAEEMGFHLPPIHLDTVRDLAPSAYRIAIRGVEATTSQLHVYHLLAVDPAGGELAIDGSPTKDPASGKPAAWISPVDRERAEAMGYDVYPPLEVMLGHLSALVRSRAGELLSRQEVRKLLDNLKETQPVVVDELLAAPPAGPGLNLGDVQQVLQALLAEGIPIHDLGTICEAMIDGARAKMPLPLTEIVRHALAHRISHLYRAADGRVHVLRLDPELDNRLAAGARRFLTNPAALGAVVAESGDDIRRLLETLGEAARRCAARGQRPVLLTSTDARFYLFNLTRRHLPDLAVISHDEIEPAVPVVTIEIVGAA